MSQNVEDDLANCGVCGTTSDVDMVECDECKRWHHYACVGVTDVIAEMPWSCNACINKTMIANENDKQDELTKDPGEKQDSEQVSRDGDSDYGCMVDLTYELERLEEERQANLFYIRKKYELISQAKSGKTNVEKTKVSQASLGTADHVLQKGGYTSHDERKFDRKAFSCDGGCGAGTGGFRPRTSELHATHLNARFAVPKELPAFTGKPEEWPAFLSSFENSTRVCGYSNAENLLRLQQAVKGKARECVSSLLLIPSLVPDVIDILKTIFGRPEHIINSLLAKIRASGQVNEKKLDTLISFSLEVKNLVATMEASDLDAHLNNPLLLSELVNRLPPNLGLEWAIASRKVQGVNLTHFSVWLYEYAVAASSLINFAPDTSKDEKKKPHRVGLHEEPKSVENNTSNARKCAMCNEGHLITVCEKFKGLKYNEKWDLVKKHKLPLLPKGS